MYSTPPAFSLKKKSWQKASRFEALRAEAGAKPPSHPAAPKDLGSELERMQGVIDDLLRERSQWMGGRHVGLAGVTEVSIPMDLGTIVDTTKQEAKDLVWRGVEFCGPSSSRR